MKRLLLALMLLMPGVAQATGRHVTTGGSGDCTIGSPCALSYANGIAAAGDTVYLTAGTYTTAAINPTSSGSIGSSIVYLGSPTSPSSVHVNNGHGLGQDNDYGLRRNYITVNGVQFTSSRDVTISGNYNSLENCIVNSYWFALEHEVNSTKLTGNTFRDVSFNLNFAASVPGYRHNLFTMKQVKQSRFDSCRFVMTQPAGVLTSSFSRFYGSNRDTFVDCGFNMKSYFVGYDDGNYFFIMRDTTGNNVFLRDTFSMTVPDGQPSNVGPVFLMSSTGTIETPRVRLNTYDECVWRIDNSNNAGGLWYQHPATDTLRNCTVVVDRGPAIRVLGNTPTVSWFVMDHCTLVSSESTVFDCGEGTSVWSGLNSITNSIFASRATVAIAPTLSLNNTGSTLTSDYNLFFSPDSAKSIVYDDGYLSISGACTGFLRECHSRFGNPLLVGGAFPLGYDAALSAGSPAIGKGFGGSDIGAKTYTGSPTIYVCPSDTLLSYANAHALPGDIVSLTAAYYDSASINPVSNGVSAARITYLANQSNAAACSLKFSIYLTKSYISVKGVKAATVASIYAPATHDSIVHCILPNLNLLGAVDCVAVSDTILGTIDIAAASARDTLRNITALVDTLPNNGYGISLKEGANNCVVDSSRFTWNLFASDSNSQGRYLASAYYNTFKDNRFVVESNANNIRADSNAFVVWTYCHDNLFLRDTMLLGLQSGFRIGGKFVTAPTVSGNTSYNNRWSHCYYLMTGSGEVKADFRFSSIDTSVIASKFGYPINIYPGTAQNSSSIKQNSLYSWVNPALKNGWNCTGNLSDSLVVERNIFYTKAAGTTGCYSIPVCDGRDTPYGSASRNNLFYSNSGNCPLNYRGNCYTSVGEGSSNCVVSPRLECGSYVYVPGWTDTTFALLDVSISTNSSACDPARWGNKYVGAKAPTCNSAPPVTNLIAWPTGDGLYSIEFTVPGNRDTCDVEYFLVIPDTAGCTLAEGWSGGEVQLISWAAGSGRFIIAYPTASPGETQRVDGIRMHFPPPGGTVPARWEILVFTYVKSAANQYSYYTSFSSCD